MLSLVWAAFVLVSAEPSKGEQSCLDAVERADEDSKIKDLRDAIEEVCNPFYKKQPLPKVSCCSTSKSECRQTEGGQKFGGYEPRNHSICICYDDNGLLGDQKKNARGSLWEELFHSLQECLRRNSAKDNPYRKIPYSSSSISIPTPDKRGTYRCSQVGSGDHSTWCKEMNAKCQNPFDGDSPSENASGGKLKKYCTSLCNVYSDTKDWMNHGCCIATCEKEYSSCCNWVTWPLQKTIVEDILNIQNPSFKCQ